MLFTKQNCRTLTACVASLILFSSASFAQFSNWYDADLEPVWRAQVTAGRRSGGAAHIYIHVSRAKFTTTFEVIHNGSSTLFAPDDLDSFGIPIGPDGAAKAADVAVRILKAEGKVAELVEHRIPKITLFAQTATGTLHVIDGETGEQLLDFSSGDPSLTSLAPAANDNFAAVVNGSKLYVWNIAERKAEFERRLGGAPAAGPAMSDDVIYVPLLGGITEAYKLKTKRQFRVPERFSSTGNTHVSPQVGPDTVSWPTDRGYLYVLDTVRNKVRYRLEARSDLVSHSTYLAPNRLMAASLEGYVFCFDDSTGQMLWEFSAGEALVQPAAGAGDQVFAVSAQSNLFSVDANNGKEMWKARGIKQVLSIGKKRVYCLGLGRLVVLDRATGAVADSISLSGGERFITNTATDRIYVANRSGAIACLRPKDAIWPTIHVGEKAYRKEMASDDASTSETPSESPAVTSDDPPMTAEAAEAAAAAEDDSLFEADDNTAEDDSLFGEEDMEGLFD